MMGYKVNSECYLVPSDQDVINIEHYFVKWNSYLVSVPALSGYS